MVRFRSACSGIGIVLGFHAAGMASLYSMWQWYDMPMHFAGGVAMGILALALWDGLVSNVTFRTKRRWVKRGFFTFCVLGFVALVGVAWEWFEFFVDYALVDVRTQWGIAQPSIGDTMMDLFLDIMGGLSVALLRKTL